MVLVIFEYTRLVIKMVFTVGIMLSCIPSLTLLTFEYMGLVIFV